MIKKLQILLIIVFLPVVSSVLPQYNPCQFISRSSSEEINVEDIIRSYHSLMYTNREILEALLLCHGVVMSLSTLTRALRKLNLRRRGVSSPLRDVLRAALTELLESGKCLGYRMLWRRLTTQYGLKVPRDTVMILLRQIDPDGVRRRKGRRLIRRRYMVPGPNFMWHVDGYDKLKPYGFSIHGCIDGFSRRMIWLEVGLTNKKPEVIANYYLNSVRELKIIPRVLRCDPGTENSLLECIQPLLRRNGTDSFRGMNSFIYGKSTSNQRIESWWCQLRKMTIDFWRAFFRDMVERNLFNETNKIQVECLRLCFMRLIRADISRCAIEWNIHKIRKQKNSEQPCGKPDHLYFAPEAFGSRNYGIAVSENEIEACQNIYQISDSVIGCSKDFAELVILLKGSIPCPINPEDGLNIYQDLLNEISNYE